MGNQGSAHAPRTLPIKRIGLPVALQDFGDRYLLAVYLSESPNPQWREAFRAVAIHRGSDPSFVRVVSDLVTFVAPREDLSRWLARVDNWIDETNQGFLAT